LPLPPQFAAVTAGIANFSVLYPFPLFFFFFFSFFFCCPLLFSTNGKPPTTSLRPSSSFPGPTYFNYESVILSVYRGTCFPSLFSTLFLSFPSFWRSYKLQSLVFLAALRFMIYFFPFFPPPREERLFFLSSFFNPPQFLCKERLRSPSHLSFCLSPTLP